MGFKDWIARITGQARTAEPAPPVTPVAAAPTEDDILAALDQSHDMSLPRFLRFITHRGGKSAGAIRVSVGIASNFADVQRFLAFAAPLRDQTRLSIGETSFDIASCRVIRDGS